MPIHTETAETTSLEVSFSYPQFLGSLSAWFRGRRVPPEEAKDLAQETIVRTLVHLKRHGQRGDDLKPLVFTIARNLIAERARHASSVVVALSDDVDVPDTEPSPLERVLQTEERTAVAAALAELGPRHRRVIELWMRGDGPADIARALGIKRNAADALLHRARRRLAMLLEDSRAFVAGLLPLRLRARARRVASLATEMDPLARLATAVAGVTAIGAATVLSLQPPTAAGAANRTHTPSATRTISVVAEKSATASPLTTRVTATKTEASKPTIRASIKNREVAIFSGRARDPKTGNSGERGTKIWYEHGDESKLDGVVDPTITVACSTVPVCGEE